MRRPHHNQYHFDQFLLGKRDALSYYYNLYVDCIHDYSQALTGSWIIATQHTEKAFVELYVKRQTIKDEAHISLFLFLTAKELAREYLREAGRLRELKEGDESLADTRTSEAGVREADLVWGEMIIAFRTPLYELHGKRRSVVVLYCFHKVPLMEIAQKLKLDRETVRNYLSESIMFLRKGFDGRWEEVNQLFS